MSHPTLSLADLKIQAKALRTALAGSGHAVSHSQSLELLARQLGHRDWNTLHASIGNAPPVPFHLDQRVSGTYLGQRFQGDIIGLREMAGGTHYRITLRFETPVDVIRFEGMSNFRTQVSAVIDRRGRTVEKTSDGQPHLVLDPA
ncbi:glyoxalase superfamily protein [Sedimentitalea sp. JM2-8]|uniref:Glyoxalase superfamily protein n=1 Tax=Sedimentitalea xiamensis TaxID=3050037 RepID=A0ABT7F8R8_9RHOB|nr:glyoxalase superfamily protein [Sedimentitalea xiamensis]MDK3071501.1 glyoxalase superfamily protein [Sedimentitalea xiamensis]